jgi:hypothetical protein
VPTGVERSVREIREGRVAHMAGTPHDQIQDIAQLLAQSWSEEAVEQILDAHAADASGHCAGCRSQVAASPVWPCRLFAIADEARRIRRGRRLRPAV